MRLCLNNYILFQQIWIINDERLFFQSHCCVFTELPLDNQICTQSLLVYPNPEYVVWTQDRTLPRLSKYILDCSHRNHPSHNPSE